MTDPPHDWAARKVADVATPLPPEEARLLRLRDEILAAFRVLIGDRELPRGPVLPDELQRRKPPER